MATQISSTYLTAYSKGTTERPLDENHVPRTTVFSPQLVEWNKISKARFDARINSLNQSQDWVQEEKRYKAWDILWHQSDIKTRREMEAKQGRIPALWIYTDFPKDLDDPLKFAMIAHAVRDKRILILGIVCSINPEEWRAIALKWFLECLGIEHVPIAFGTGAIRGMYAGTHFPNDFEFSYLSQIPDTSIYRNKLENHHPERYYGLRHDSEDLHIAFGVNMFRQARLARQKVRMCLLTSFCDVNRFVKFLRSYDPQLLWDVLSEEHMQAGASVDDPDWNHGKGPNVYGEQVRPDKMATNNKFDWQSSIDHMQDLDRDQIEYQKLYQREYQKMYQRECQLQRRIHWTVQTKEAALKIPITRQEFDDVFDNKYKKSKLTGIYLRRTYAADYLVSICKGQLETYFMDTLYEETQYHGDVHTAEWYITLRLPCKRPNAYEVEGYVLTIMDLLEKNGWLQQHRSHIESELVKYRSEIAKLPDKKILRSKVACTALRYILEMLADMVALRDAGSIASHIVALGSIFKKRYTEALRNVSKNKIRTKDPRKIAPKACREALKILYSDSRTYSMPLETEKAKDIVNQQLQRMLYEAARVLGDKSISDFQPPEINNVNTVFNALWEKSGQTEWDGKCKVMEMLTPAPDWLNMQQFLFDPIKYDVNILVYDAIAGLCATSDAISGPCATSDAIAGRYATSNAIANSVIDKGLRNKPYIVWKGNMQSIVGYTAKTDDKTSQAAEQGVDNLWAGVKYNIVQSWQRSIYQPASLVGDFTGSKMLQGPQIQQPYLMQQPQYRSQAVTQGSGQLVIDTTLLYRGSTQSGFAPSTAKKTHQCTFDSSKGSAHYPEHLGFVGLTN
ncbi:hypothetical protein B0J11DRAFT_586423 [Dendryphion nanum]|uniref:Uncharacterized protein n=1 Tax=Dendryphion nanum TaxID=256645 RepID=A0A9P9CZF0_9PLEO|nr:hypothetical protein B0J11DRAFT_586423 [Dendryphion nanum]